MTIEKDGVPESHDHLLDEGQKGPERLRVVRIRFTQLV